MSAATTLTDRYVAEVLRTIPRRQRADIESELRASIADDVDDRLTSGMDAVAAESAVLAELGAPRRLAANYSERPSYLIGPELFADYRRLLAVLLSTIPPLWFVVSGIALFVDGSTALESSAAALWGTIETAAAIAFFVTLVFAVLERTPTMRTRRTAAWDPHTLPAVLDKRSHFAELAGGVILLVIIATALVLVQTVGAVEGAGGVFVGPIDTQLWQGGALLVALLYSVASISFHVFAYYTGWSTSNAIASVILDVLFLVPAVWLVASGRLLNRAYFEAIGWPDGVDVVRNIVLAVVIVMPVLDSVDAIVRAARKRRTR